MSSGNGSQAPGASASGVQPAAYSEQLIPKRHEFAQLDGLRALAAFLVLCVHTAAISGMLTDTGSPLRAFTARLDVGVMIFFLLSGFLIYRPFARANLESRKSPTAANYAWRRAIRIVPAYWVALTVITVWLNFQPTVFTASGIPKFYGFLQVYDPATVVQGISQAWTLCIEVSFYLFVPIFALVVRAISRRVDSPIRGEMLGLAGLVVLAVVCKAALLIVEPVRELQTASVAVSTLPWYLGQFAVGMILAVLSLRLATQARPHFWGIPARYVPLLCWLAGLGALVFVSKGIGLTGFLGETESKTQILSHDLLYTLAALFFLLPAVFVSTKLTRIGRVFASKPAIFLGGISYSFYLYHLALLAQLNLWGFGDVAEKTPFPYLVWLLAGFAGTVVISTASFYFVERPFLRLRSSRR